MSHKVAVRGALKKPSTGSGWAASFVIYLSSQLQAWMTLIWKDVVNALPIFSTSLFFSHREYLHGALRCAREAKITNFLPWPEQEVCFHHSKEQENKIHIRYSLHGQTKHNKYLQRNLTQYCQCCSCLEKVNKLVIEMLQLISYLYQY